MAACRVDPHGSEFRHRCPRAAPGVGGGEGLAPDDLSDGAGLAYPVLGSVLSDAAEQYLAAAGSDAIQGLAPARPHVPGDPGNLTATTLALSITVEGDTKRIVRLIEAHGGTVHNALDGYIEADVPLSALAPLAEAGGVTWARELARPIKNRGTLTSAGVAAHLADAWHTEGIRGRGVKIGVIDTSTTATSKDGFSWLQDLLGSDLPSTVKGHCYTDFGNPTSDLDNCTGGSSGGFLWLFGGDSHGTVVAETVMDVAPDASLYIANPGTWADLRRSVEWMHSQGVKVIVHSVSWAFHGAADGTSPFRYGPLNTVKWAADNGIVWVNSAGNNGQRSWFGAFKDGDNDNKHEWNDTTECQTFLMRSGDQLSVLLRWDDTWGGASKDLSLHFVSNPCTAREQVVATSNNPQSGGAAHYPREIVDFEAPHQGRFAVQVRRNSGTAPSWLQMILFSRGVDLPIYTTSHGVTSPGDSPHQGVLAVAAAQHNIKYSAISYSSRGPTPDNRQKPDITGASVTITATRGTFGGTSAAAPHVAGLAALVVQQNPTFTPAQVAGYLETHANIGWLRKGKPNYETGHGFAELPSHGCHDPINASGATSGAWSSSCKSAVDGNKHSRYYSISVPQQTTVTIGLSSTVDAFLNVRKGYNAQKGAVLHQDDNSGSGTDARISETLAAGRYTIEATTASDGETGTFTLNLAGLATVPEVSISAGADVTEGEDVTFTVSASPKPTSPLDVSVSVSQSGDFGVSAGKRTVTIPTGGMNTNQNSPPKRGNSKGFPQNRRCQGSRMTGGSLWGLTLRACVICLVGLGGLPGVGAPGSPTGTPPKSPTPPPTSSKGQTGRVRVHQLR